MKRCLDKQTNTRTKKVFALIDNGDGTFAVFALCSNYDGHAPHGLRQTWRLTICSNADEAVASKYFSKRVGR